MGLRILWRSGDLRNCMHGARRTHLSPTIEGGDLEGNDCKDQLKSHNVSADHQFGTEEESDL